VGGKLPDERIRTVRVERIGSPAGVRNVALRMARGEFIAFLDADDRYFPDTLARLAEHLAQTPRLNAVYGFPRLMDESGERLPSLPHAPPTWENIVTSRSSCQLPALLLRKNVLEHIGLFNEALSGVEDFEFYLRLYLYDYEGIACLNEEVYDYRVYAASLTKSPGQAQRLLDSALSIFDWLFAEPRLPAFVQAHRSRAYAGCYRYLARERLLHGQPALCRQIVRQACRNPNIIPRDFLRQCGPLLLRSFFPSAFDRWLVRLRRQIRERRRINTENAIQLLL
jgi:glycosyltransferase involved in cell wall biosynthesis